MKKEACPECKKTDKVKTDNVPKNTFKEDFYNYNWWMCWRCFKEFRTPVGKEGYYEPHEKCPKCESFDVIPILYGLPSKEAELLKKEGKVEFGGCKVVEYYPKWHCKSCEKEF